MEPKVNENENAQKTAVPFQWHV